MEDRHAVSEPRPVESNGHDENLPSWEVDILRDDTVIVDTFLLNKNVLPPRTNKRGKVVWRLPDKTDKLPSFGTDDRRRILDIFKERKKKRKQEKKKRNISPSQSGDLGTPETYERQSSSQSTSPGGGGFGDRNGKNERHDSVDKRPGGSSGIEVKPKIKVKENGSRSIGNFSKECDAYNFTEGKGQKENKKNDPYDRGRGAIRSSEPQHSQAFVPPGPSPSGHGLPTIKAPQRTSSSSSSSLGQHQSQSHITRLHPPVPSTPDPSRISLGDSRGALTPSQPHSSHEKPVVSSQTSFTIPPPPDALFVTVPREERPESLPGQPESSLAVPAARHFISQYYAHFDGSLPGVPIGDLVRYYTPKAQKSVSIGGAHSVVTGRMDIAAQILSLAGAAFVVRGVVAQDTADGKGVHMLVTGTARTALNGAAVGVVASFAHSVSLVYTNIEPGTGDGICPSLIEALKIGFPFQIHNDALALLSDAGPVTPTPIPPLAQTQHLPPPPPGLF